MQDLLLFVNKLPPVDIWFFALCGVAIVAIVAVYFLIPVFNKKQYKEQRDNLKKREESFKATRTATVEETATEAEATPVELDAAAESTAKPKKSSKKSKKD